MMNRGDVYWVNLNPTQGAAIKKQHPCVIMSATPINQARRTVVIIPLSTQATPRPPLLIPVICDDRQVVAICDQIRAVDKKRMTSQLGQLSPHDMQTLNNGLKQVLSLSF